MRDDEASKIILKLSALFPNTTISEETTAVWIGYLLPLQADVMRQTVNEYALSPGRKFFPTPGEILEIYDRIYSDCMTKKIEQDRQAERDAVKRLFQRPISTFTDDYEKKSVQLIREVCAGEIRYGSVEWRQQFQEIYGVGIDPMTGM